jgi:hypothetical protein
MQNFSRCHRPCSSTPFCTPYGLYRKFNLTPVFSFLKLKFETVRQFDPDERKIAEGVLDSLINNHQAKRLFAKQSTEHSNS